MKYGIYKMNEPVALRYDFDGNGYLYMDVGSGSDWKTRVKDCEFLYTHPMRELTDEEIADLKIANQDLKYQLIQKSGELILADFDIKELEKEIEHLKSKVQYWKAREK
jgi:hypothetical protein